MVVATKPGKIRICLDLQELNKVIQRPKYLIPALEELLPIVSCPKTESSEKQNEKDGFYQNSLYEASSKLTKFWISIFCHRYLSMPFGSLSPE